MPNTQHPDPLLNSYANLYEIELAARFPRLHRHGPCLNFSIRPGWHGIIETALTAIDLALDDEQAATFEILQVKEKFGSLRFYYRLGPRRDLHVDALYSTSGRTHLVIPAASRDDESAMQRVREIVDSASEASQSICEMCGQPGESREGDWIKTLCEAHDQERRRPGYAGFDTYSARDRAFLALRVLKRLGIGALIPCNRAGEPDLDSRGNLTAVLEEVIPSTRYKEAEKEISKILWKLPPRVLLYPRDQLSDAEMERHRAGPFLVYSPKSGLALGG